MKISVTQEHIKKGKPRAHCACPVALAIKEVTPWCPMVDSKFVEFGSFVMDLPQEVTTFIDLFDHGHPVEPFEFELEIPRYG